MSTGIGQTIGLTLNEAKELKKGCESEINKIIKSFEERTHIRVESVSVESNSTSFSTTTLTCKL